MPPRFVAALCPTESLQEELNAEELLPRRGDCKSPEPPVYDK